MKIYKFKILIDIDNKLTIDIPYIKNAVFEIDNKTGKEIRLLSDEELIPVENDLIKSEKIPYIIH